MLDTRVVETTEATRCLGQAYVPVAANMNQSRANPSRASDVALAMELVVAGCNTMRDELRWELPPSATRSDGPDLALGAFRKLFFGIARLASIANRLGTNVHDRQQIDDALDVLSEDWPGVLAFVEELCQAGRTPPSQTSFLFCKLAELSSSFGFLRQSRSLSTLLDAANPANTGGRMENLQCNDANIGPSTCSMPVGVTSREWRAEEKPACGTREASQPGSAQGISPPSSPCLSKKKLHVPCDPEGRFQPAGNLLANEIATSTPRMSTLQEPDNIRGLQSALPLTGVDWPDKPLASSTRSTSSTVSTERSSTVSTERRTRIGSQHCCRQRVHQWNQSVHESSSQIEACKQLPGRGLVGQRVCALEAKLQAVGGAKPSEKKQRQQQQQQ